MRDLMRDGLMPAVRTDATVFRAFVRSFNLLDPPDALITDPDVVGRVMTAYQDRDQRPPGATPRPAPRRAARRAHLGLRPRDHDREPHMADLIYAAITSLDGYVADREAPSTGRRPTRRCTRSSTTWRDPSAPISTAAGCTT